MSNICITDGPKLCINCAHFRPDAAFLRFNECAAPQDLTVDPVTGDRIGKFKYCDILRGTDIPQTCGPNARWFEPKSDPERLTAAIERCKDGMSITPAVAA